MRDELTAMSLGKFQVSLIYISVSRFMFSYFETFFSYCESNVLVRCV